MCLQYCNVFLESSKNWCGYYFKIATSVMGLFFASGNLLYRTSQNATAILLHRFGHKERLGDFFLILAFLWGCVIFNFYMYKFNYCSKNLNARTVLRQRRSHYKWTMLLFIISQKSGLPIYSSQSDCKNLPIYESSLVNMYFSELVKGLTVTCRYLSFITF
jgi:hypothetical protein